jgi:transcriptional regulator with XRE-family HTH domain
MLEVKNEMLDPQQRQELANFLKTRRYRIQPEEVGLIRSGRRRTPGLRREEVAIFAGVSTEWYTWLEQGRDIQASQETIERIGTALKLEPSEITHLLRLAGYQPLPEQPQETEAVSPQMQRVLAQLNFTPAYVLGRRWDILAWNDATTLLFGDLSTQSGLDRNCLWQTFMGRLMRPMMIDWENQAKSMMASFRATRAKYLGDSWVEELVNALKEACPEFREWWNQYEVRDWNDGVKIFEHPAYGRLSFEYTAFQLVDRHHWELMLITYVPLPDTDTQTKLEAAKRTLDEIR